MKPSDFGYIIGRISTIFALFCFISFILVSLMVLVFQEFGVWGWFVNGLICIMVLSVVLMSGFFDGKVKKRVSVK